MYLCDFISFCDGFHLKAMIANNRFRERSRDVKDFRGVIETAGSDPAVSLTYTIYICETALARESGLLGGWGIV
jgi:hypothetical protein